jgi:uncharacterized protein
MKGPRKAGIITLMHERTTAHNSQMYHLEDDILLKGLIHKVMVFFHLPAAWPAWGVGLLLLLLVGLAGAGWWLFSAAMTTALAVTGLLLAFMLLDVALLVQLPRRAISFGPWQAQAFALAVPRLLVALALTPLALWWGWAWGLGLLLLAQGAGTALLFYGAVIEPHRLSLTELTVTTDRLPAASEPIRVLHISDLHIERWTARETAVLQFVQQANPDLIVISGDYVNLSYNEDAETQRLVVRLLRQLSAPHGVYAVLGSPPVDLRQTVLPIFAEVPHIKLLRGDWQVVEMGENGRSLAILGMDCTHHLPTDRARLDQLHQLAPNGLPQLFLYHSPELMPEAAAREIDLYLCGHTHGGQVRLPLLGPILTSSQLGRRYVMGLYREGRTHLYISRGIGLEGLSAPRVRFLAPPEMTLVTIRGG